MKLPDMQNEKIDSIDLDSVGVKGLQLPVRVKCKHGGYATVKADMKMGVKLDGTQKGTHMSRFVEFLEEQADSNIDMKNIQKWVSVLSEQQDSKDASITMEFEYPMRKFAPVSNIGGTIYYDVMFKVRSDRKVLAVDVPITTLCPCSKEISDYGAHNQKAIVHVAIRLNDEFIWIEDIIKAVEQCGSAPVYSVLKRPDEKYVTEKAYDNPKFVEDVCRDVAKAIDEFEFVDAIIEVTSHESIHDHHAFARVLI